MSEALPVLAIDIGGTKLAAAIVSTVGVVVRRDQVPTLPREAGLGDVLWSTLVDLIDTVVGDDELSGVGVGCGGPMSWAAGEVSPLNLPAWRDFPLVGSLQERFPGLVVRLANDAVTAAIGEHWRGNGQGVAALLGVVISTGVGGGLVLDGRIVFGASGNAGHLGHITVDPDGPLCGCGNRGCLEAIARGPAVVQRAVDLGWTPADGHAVDGHGLLASACDGDQVAIDAFANAGDAVGVALASAAHLLELDLITIGGGLANAGDLLFTPIRESFARHAGMEFAARCRIEPASLGNDSGLVGAAALVAAGDRYWPAC